MNSAGFVRAQHTPFRIEPQCGQVSKDCPESAKSKSWGIFHEDEPWSNLANNA
jgi:hypothetical protein